MVLSKGRSKECSNDVRRRNGTRSSLLMVAGPDVKLWTGAVASWKIKRDATAEDELQPLQHCQWQEVSVAFGSVRFGPV